MTEHNSKIDLLSEQATKEIDDWLVKYPEDRRQSALLPALMLVQDQHAGWLSSDLIEAVADYLRIPRIVAFEAATFYSMYDLEKTGKYKLNVCTNVSCQLAGSEAIVAHLEQRLGIKIGETSKNGKFSLRSVECLGACVEAPVMHLQNQYHERLTPEKVDKILDGLE